NITLQYSLRYLGLYRCDLDFRAGVDVESGNHAAMLGIVLKILELYFGGQSVLALKPVLHRLNSLACAGIGDLAPPVNDGYAPSGGAQDGSIGKFRLALQNRHSIPGPLPSLYGEGDEYLLCLVVALDFRFGLRLVEAIGLQQVIDAVDGG